MALVKEGMADDFVICENKCMRADITHYHTIDYKFFATLPLVKRRGLDGGYVHFLPETVETSIRLPRLIKNIFYKYTITFYKRMDYLVTVNSYFIERLAAYGVDRKKVTYIPNFVSGEVFYRRSDEERRRLRTTRCRRTALSYWGVGQLQVRKGIFDFIEVAERLPDVTFVWAGGFFFRRGDRRVFAHQEDYGESAAQYPVSGYSRPGQDAGGLQYRRRDVLAVL